MKSSAYEDSFGLPLFGSYLHSTMIFTSLVALLCTALFIVGFAAFTNDKRSLQQVSWIHATTEFQSVTNNQYFGLLGIYTIISTSGQNMISSYISYSDNNQCGLSITTTIDQMTTSMCSQCAKAGQVAFYLSLVSFFLSAAVVIATMSRILFLNTHGVKYISILTCILILLFTLAAFVNWSTNCYSYVQTEVVRDAPSGSLITVSYSIGFDSIVTGFVCMVGVLLLHIFTPSHSHDQEFSGSIRSTSRTRKNPLSISLQRENDTNDNDNASHGEESDNNSTSGDSSCKVVNNNNNNNACDDMETDIEAPLSNHRLLKRSISSEPDFGCPSHFNGSDKSLITETQI
jgi:hypothetical protein